jgi:hypothetical protein
MLFLAVPMTLLFLASEVITRLADRRRAKRSTEPAYDALGDDAISPIDVRHDPEDERPSRLED